MSVITVSRRVASPIAKVWTALSDFGGVYRLTGLDHHLATSEPIGRGWREA